MLREGDPGWAESYDKEVEFCVPEGLPGGGVLHGTFEIMEFLATMREYFEEAYPDPEQFFLLAPDQTIVLGTFYARAAGTGHELRIPFAHHFRSNDEGKIVYFRNYIDSGPVMEVVAEADAGGS